MEEKSIIIKPDFHCELFIDNVFQTIAIARTDIEIVGLTAGKHSLKCVCTICDMVIEQEINIPVDSKIEISFEDYLFQHPECIKYQLDFQVFLDWFPKLAEKWKDLEIVNREPLWANECLLDIPVNIRKGGKEGYVDVLGNEADYYYIIRERNKYGYAKGLGNVIKPCVYEGISLFDYQQMNLDLVLEHLGMTDKYRNDMMSQADWDKSKEFLKEYGDEYPFALDHDVFVRPPYDDGCAFLCLNDKLINSSQKWGIINLKKKLETPIKYSHIHSGGSKFTYFGKIAVDVDGKWGAFDFEKFTEIVDCQYDFIDFRDDKYIRYYQGGLCGLMDPEGHKLTEAKYLQIKELSDGLFRVKQGDKWGFVNDKGQECIPCVFDKVEDFNGGVAKYYEREVFGFINDYGDRLTKATYAESEMMPNGQIKVREDLYWGVINHDGTEYLPMEYDTVVSFNEIVIGIKEEEGKISLSTTGAVFNCEHYRPLDAEHICICNNGKWKLFYTTGKSVLADCFDSISILVQGKLLYFKMGSRYALYNLSEHKYITSFIYDDIFFCDNGRIALNKSGMWGFLDKDGEELIPCEFKELYNWFGHISHFRDINIECDKYGNGVWMPTIYLRSINLRTKS